MSSSTCLETAATYAALTALAKSGLSDGDQRLVLSRTTVGDGGQGTFRWDTGSTATTFDGLVLQADEGGAGRWVRDFLGPVEPEWSGATGDGTTDDAAAIKVCVDYLESIGGGTLEFSAKTYAIGASINATKDGTHFLGQGRVGTEIKAIANSLFMFHISADDCSVTRMTINANNQTGITCLRVTPQDEGQTTTLVTQNFNHFSQLVLTGNADEGAVLQCGPDVAGSDSNCFYNTFEDIHFLNVVRGVFLKNGPNASSSGNNRNRFSRCRFGSTGGGSGNIGIQIDSADTCIFESCAFEGIQLGTSPSSTPTAVKIAASGTFSGDNILNTFMGCRWEACIRDIDNAAAQTGFIDCNAAASRSLWTAEPAIFINSDGSNQGNWLQGAFYQADSLISGHPNSQFEITAARGLNTKRSNIIEADGNAGHLAIEQVFQVGAISTSKTITIADSNIIDPIKRYALSGEVVLTGTSDATNHYPFLATYRIIAKIEPSLLQQWGVDQVQQSESLGVDDYRAMTELDVSLGLVSGELQMTVSGTTIQDSQAWLRYNLVEVAH